MPRKLKHDTVALRVHTAPSTQADKPFGKCGLWFTREPILVKVSQVGERAAKAICADHQLVVEQLATIPKRRDKKKPMSKTVELVSTKSSTSWFPKEGD